MSFVSGHIQRSQISIARGRDYGRRRRSWRATTFGDSAQAAPRALGTLSCRLPSFRRRRHRQPLSNALREGGILVGGVGAVIHARDPLELRERSTRVEPAEIVEIFRHIAAEKDLPR